MKALSVEQQGLGVHRLQSPLGKLYLLYYCLKKNYELNVIFIQHHLLFINFTHKHQHGDF